jgi:diguanylate cyclase (GGDEF)-like protein
VDEPRVLIVDDDAAERELLKQILIGEGCQLLETDSGEEALGILRAGGADVFLLDIMLADPDGFDIVARAREAAQGVQIVAMSGLDETEYLDQAIRSGVDDFVRKPVSATELRARLRAAVLRRGTQQTLVKDLEFFRNAAAEEERLSSLVLDQNVSLKEANERIQRLNEDLEHANGELEELAANDPLSGLLNRRSLFQKIDADIERSKRHGDDLTAVLLDIDNFKTINDTYGHVCGDHVIRDLGARTRATLRRYDYAGRYGGEEFMMVLQNTNVGDAVLVAERLLEGIRELSFECDDRVFAVTISIGVAQFRDGDSTESWVDSADQALYRAKQNGKNRIESEERKPGRCDNLDFTKLPSQPAFERVESVRE